MPIAIPLLFMAVPVVIASIWFALWRVQRRSTQSARTAPVGWLRAQGVVVDEVTTLASTGAAVNRRYLHVRQPIVRYRTALGVESTFRSPLRATVMPRPGDIVEVVHDPHDPSQARIAPESIPTVIRRMPTITGVVLLVIGVPMLVLFDAIGVLILRSR